MSPYKKDLRDRLEAMLFVALPVYKRTDNACHGTSEISGNRVLRGWPCIAGGAQRKYIRRLSLNAYAEQFSAWGFLAYRYQSSERTCQLIEDVLRSALRLCAAWKHASGIRSHPLFMKIPQLQSHPITLGARVIFRTMLGPKSHDPGWTSENAPSCCGGNKIQAAYITSQLHSIYAWGPSVIACLKLMNKEQQNYCELRRCMCLGCGAEARLAHFERLDRDWAAIGRVPSFLFPSLIGSRSRWQVLK